MAAVKHAGARWLDEMYDYIKDSPQLIVIAGIPQAIDLFYVEQVEEENDDEEDNVDTEDENNIIFWVATYQL